MKAQPLLWTGKSFDKCEPAVATHVKFVMPGPVGQLMLPVKPPHGWEWNRSVDAPTLRPSILTTSEHQGLRCHSYLTDGIVEFLSDCSHELKGQKVPLLEVTEEPEPPSADDTSSR